MNYIYETHMHCSQASACAGSTGAEMARAYKEAGYTGIIMTDHFFNGNSAISKDLPWEARVNGFCAGYEDAYAEGQRIGLQVFFGLESNFNGQEFLIYGVDKQWLLAHPEIETVTPDVQYKLVHEAGGMVIQAHPFREDWYIDKVRVYADAIDGVEVYNIGNERRGALLNDRAGYYSKRFNIPATSGSDSHKVADGRGGMIFSRRFTDIHDYIRAILKREPATLLRRAEPYEEVAPLNVPEDEQPEWDALMKETQVFLKC